MAEILKVSSTSDPSATAGALANTIREEGIAELQAIGPKAVNQAVKAITIARGYMAPSGVDLIFVPSFVDVQIDDENKTAMRMEVRTRLPFKPTKGKEEEDTNSNEPDREGEPAAEELAEGEEAEEEEEEIEEDYPPEDDEEDILDI
ncbi:stage V sporulation protein S [Candidatus Bipolaricaulota bacterium]|nr:stage V sporulation protein S [Candidatus Bipolaricaulota bacterium]MBS3791926.1 stage V sporulation protein S [Candidatus Bipolaricaulota bacterium]